MSRGSVTADLSMKSVLFLGTLALGDALNIQMSAAPAGATATVASKTREPLLLRAARGEVTETTPVWMMRQAGRHMKCYRDLVKDYPTFRERSEIPDVSFEISMQPRDAYGTDGVILFSDILTPLPAMGVDFSISEGGAISIDPIRTRDAFTKMTAMPFEPEKGCHFVGEVLSRLRLQLAGTDATVLGFVGLPFTLGTYLIEGATGTKTGFAAMRGLRESDPQLTKDMLSLVADRIAQYAIYQIDSGAQVIQVFDSWAGHLTSDEFDEWAAPYQRQVVGAIKKARPDTPVIIYMAPDTHSKGGALLERLASSGVNMVSIDHTISLAQARQQLDAAGYEDVGIQGNLDPAILCEGTPEEIVAATEAILEQAAGRPHIMNLGHGIEATTPEPNADLFVSTVHRYRSK